MAKDARRLATGELTQQCLSLGSAALLASNVRSDAGEIRFGLLRYQHHLNSGAPDFVTTVA